MLRALAVIVVVLAALAAPALTAQVASADSTYEVQDGDTLLAVAVKLGVPNGQVLDWVTSAVKLNGLGDADSLKVGQVLKLPSGATVSTNQTTSGATTVSKSTATGSGVYAVQDGDTLLDIAAKLGIPADQRPAWITKVLALNNLADAEQLAAGQSLKLPSDSDSRPATQPVLVSAASATAPAPATSSTSSSSTSSAGTFSGSATAYHDSFTNKMMGCTGAGPYTPTDLSVIAVGPAMYDQFPCGTKIEVCGPKGCLSGVRKDACPGCQGYHVDLSRAGLTAVCGPNTCDVRLRRLP